MKRLIPVLPFFIPLSLILAAPVMREPTRDHWHSASEPHGVWMNGEPMTAEECEELFGGEGW